MTVYNAGDVILAATHQKEQLFGRVASDQQATSDTSLDDLAGMSVTLEANATYVFNAYIFYSAPVDNVSDIKVQWVNPAGATHTQIAFGLATTTTGSAPYNQVQLAAVSFTASVISAGSTGTVQCLHVVGTIRTGATAGISKVQFAQNASSANTLTVKAETFMIYERQNV